MTADKKDTTQLPATKDDTKVMEFVPFGASDKIKLSVVIIKTLVAVKTKSGHTCSDQDAIKFMMMCQARRLNPFEGDAFLIGYDSKDGPTFSLITAHQAFLKRAEVNPEYNGMKSGIIIRRDGEVRDVEGDFYLEGDELLGGWATVFFKNRAQPMHKRIRLKRFQKSWGIWQDDPAGMICKCAEADALRASFPTMLGGLYLREEVSTIEPAKFSAPVFETKKLFDAPTVPVEGTSATEGKPQPAVEKVRAFCKIAGVKEETVIFFLKEVGIAEQDTEKLEQLSESALETLINQWDDIAKRVKELAATPA